MAEYPGASWSGVSVNKSPRQGTIKLFIIHHWAGGYINQAAAAVAQRAIFMNANERKVSPNWQVNADGSVWEIVPPTPYRAWTSGSIDHQAVTVETQNIAGAPTWDISDKSEEAIAHILAWAHKKYGIPLQRGKTASGNVVVTPGVIGHREVVGSSTACPGPSMRIDWIIERAKQLVASTAGTPGVKGKNKMWLIWDTNGTGWLVTPDGWRWVPNMQVYNLMKRVINSNQTADKPETFNSAEIEMMVDLMNNPVYASPKEATKAIRLKDVKDSGIILQDGVPPFTLVDAVFEAMRDALGMPVRILEKWQYDTVVREQHVAANKAAALEPAGGAGGGAGPTAEQIAIEVEKKLADDFAKIPATVDVALDDEFAAIPKAVTNEIAS